MYKVIRPIAVFGNDIKNNLFMTLWHILDKIDQNI